MRNLSIWMGVIDMGIMILKVKDVINVIKLTKFILLIKLF